MKIACICAYPRHMNYGMLSTDLAFENFCANSLQTRFDITYFNIEEEIYIECGNNRSIQYRLLHTPDKQLDGYDLIIIWGDFTTSHIYAVTTTKRLKEKHKLSEQEAEAYYLKRLLLKGCSKEIKKKVMILCSNTLTNSEFRVSPIYRESVFDLYHNAAAIIPRDPISSAMAQIMRGDHRGVSCGIDAAFFLSTPQSNEEDSIKNKIGYSFSRSVRRNKPFTKKAAHRLIRGISKLSGFPAENVGWKASGGDPCEFFDTVESLRSYKFIVTDTYHCAINSIREGVPVICLGEGAAFQLTAISDKKKELIFQNFMGDEYYIFSDRLDFLFNGKKLARKSLAVVQDVSAFSAFSRNLQVAKQNQLDAFREAVDVLLNS